jgi:hypothetical protein
MGDPNTYRVSADEVHPGIWVGNQAAAASCSFVNSHGFTLIVNCTSHLPNYHERCGNAHRYPYVRYLRIPVGDPGPPETPGWQGAQDVDLMYRMMPVICRKILEERQRGGKVLIHCHAGMQRSAGLAAGYIMRYCCNPGWNQPTRYRVAVDVLVRNRPVAFFGGSSVNFRGALLDRPLLVFRPH